MDHLPLLARRALPVANNRMVECVMCFNGAMADCVLRTLFGEAIDRLGKSSVGPAKQGPGICGSTVGPLLHIGSSLALTPEYISQWLPSSAGYSTY